MSARCLYPIVATGAVLLMLAAGPAFRVASGADDEQAPLPKKAASLKFKYDVARAELQKPLKTLRERYRTRLETVAAERQAAGDLEGLVAVNNELKHLKEKGDANHKPPEGEPGDLIQSRRIFVRENDALKRVIARKNEPLDRTFRENLERIGKEYALEGKLADALAITNYVNALPAPGTSQPQPGPGKLALKIQIDGLSHLYLRGNEMWFDHSQGTVAPPGRHRGDFPTYLNGDTEWLPKWTGKVTDHHDAGIGLPISGEPPRIHLRFLEGRGSAEVIEQPDRSNDYTAKIEIRDHSPEGRKFAGSSWAEFRLTW